MNELPWPFVALVLGALITAFLGLYAWVANIRAAIDVRLGRLERDDGVLGERVSHLPTSCQVSELSVAVAKLTSELESFRRSNDAIWQRLELHEEWYHDWEQRHEQPN